MARVGVWMRLMQGKKGDCTITPIDRVQLMEDIDAKLDRGWTEQEVYDFLRWSEYFNNLTPEEECLRRMREAHKRVDARLKGTPNG